MGNVSEHSGDLGRVVSLARVNEALCMADISVSELLWTTTSGLRDIGSVFRPESGDGRSPMSCRSCNLASTLTRINKGKDSCNFRRRQGMHCRFGGIRVQKPLVFMHYGCYVVYRCLW